MDPRTRCPWKNSRNDLIVAWKLQGKEWCRHEGKGARFHVRINLVPVTSRVRLNSTCNAPRAFSAFDLSFDSGSL